MIVSTWINLNPKLRNRLIHCKSDTSYINPNHDSLVCIDSQDLAAEGSSSTCQISGTNRPSRTSSWNRQVSILLDLKVHSLYLTSLYVIICLFITGPAGWRPVGPRADRDGCGALSNGRRRLRSAPRPPWRLAADHPTTDLRLAPTGYTDFLITFESL